MKPMNSLKKSFLALCLLTVSACSALPFLNPASRSTSTLQASGNAAYQARQQALWQQFQNKPAYIGPVKMAIHTDLLNPGQSGKHVDLTDKLDPQGFRTQSLPQGPLVFQETFTKGQGQYEVLRGIRITNTSVRYTLHVETKDKKADGQISVNINGTNWIKAKPIFSSKFTFAGFVS